MYKYHYYEGYDCWHFKFDKSEGLELHEHMPLNYHDTLVLTGSIQISGPDNSWSKTLKANERYNYTDDEMHHALIALEDDTEILNIYRNPMPNIASLEHKGWFM